MNGPAITTRSNNSRNESER